MTVGNSSERRDSDVETLEALDQLDSMEFADESNRDVSGDAASDAVDDPEDSELDELDLLVEEYLDGELKGSERDAFEARIASDPALKERVDAARATFDVVEEFDEEPDETSATLELTERTVERLNSEARSELESYDARERAERRRDALVQILAPVLLFLAGCAVFAAALPNPARQRERDAAVVERLAQLEAAGSFEFLAALANANLFEEWKKTFPARPPVDTSSSANAEPARERSYADLVKDPVFYRLQRRFEALDPETREKYRALRNQIDKSPDRDKLLQTLDDYVAWLDASTNSSERERIVAAPDDVKMMEIRRKINDSKKFRDLLDSARNNRGETENESQPRDERAGHRDAAPGSALRAALPDSLQNEDFQKIYEQYARYRAQKNATAGEGESRRDDVVEFLANVEPEELAKDFSPDAKKALDALDPERRSSLMGLIVSLSLVENDKKVVPSRPFQNRENPVFFGGSRRDSTRELAETLRKANQEERDLVTSLPPMEARGALMGLAWGFFSPNPGADFGRAPNRIPGNNPRTNRESPRDAHEGRAPGAFPDSPERGEFAPPEFGERRNLGRFGVQPQPTTENQNRTKRDDGIDKRGEGR